MSKTILNISLNDTEGNPKLDITFDKEFPRETTIGLLMAWLEHKVLTGAISDESLNALYDIGCYLVAAPVAAAGEKDMEKFLGPIKNIMKACADYHEAIEKELFHNNA